MLLHLSSSAMKRPAIWLAVWIALTLLCALGFLRLQIRTDWATIYPDHDETIRQTETDRLVFQDPEEIILLFTALPEGSRSHPRKAFGSCAKPTSLSNSSTV